MKAIHMDNMHVGIVEKVTYGNIKGPILFLVWKVWGRLMSVSALPTSFIILLCKKFKVIYSFIAPIFIYHMELSVQPVKGFLECSSSKISSGSTSALSYSMSAVPGWLACAISCAICHAAAEQPSFSCSTASSWCSNYSRVPCCLCNALHTGSPWWCRINTYVCANFPQLGTPEIDASPLLDSLQGIIPMCGMHACLT